MKALESPFALWILALVITLAAAYYQRVTGPTYPVKGEVAVEGETIPFKLIRSHGGEGDQPVTITVGENIAGGTLIWRRYMSGDDWHRQPMRKDGSTLTGTIPHQPPAGKVEYRVELTSVSGAAVVFPDEPVITRFKGDVPLGFLLPHVLAMFSAMFLSTRTALEALRKDGKPRTYAYWTLALMFAGGIILGPIVQKYAFGAFWTGIPFGTDLTDNKTLIAFAAWIVAVVAVRDGVNRKWWVIGAAVVTIVIFSIPHSMAGSELDYKTGKMKNEGFSRAVAQPRDATFRFRPSTQFRAT